MVPALRSAVDGARLRAVGIGATGPSRPLAEWARSVALDGRALIALGVFTEACDGVVADECLVDARYAPYVAREDGKVAELRGDLALTLRADLDYGRIPGLSREMVERLEAARPGSVAAAARMRGITPSAIAALLVANRLRERGDFDAICST
jgi:tRNA uridine 5-carboxymethylaminomethyl modification enzyme